MKCLICDGSATQKAIMSFLDGQDESDITGFRFPACETCIANGSGLLARKMLVHAFLVVWILGLIPAACYFGWKVEPPYDMSNALFVNGVLTACAFVVGFVMYVCLQVGVNKRLNVFLNGPLGKAADAHELTEIWLCDEEQKLIARLKDANKKIRIIELT